MPTNDKFFTRPSYDRQISQFSGGTGEFSGSSIFKEFVDVGTPLADLPIGLNITTTGATTTSSGESSSFTSTTSVNTFNFSTGEIQAESYRLSAITTSNSGTTQSISLRFSATTTYLAEGNTYYDDYTGVTYNFNVMSMSGSGSFYTGTCSASTVSVYSGITHEWIRRKSGSTIFLAVTGGTQTDRLFVDNNAIVGGDLFVTGNTTVGGNLNIIGTSTTLQTEIIQAEDNNIDLNYGGNYASASGGGIRLLYGQSSTVHSSITADTTGMWIIEPSLSSTTGNFGGAVNISGATTLGSTLTTAGASIFNNNVTITGNSYVSGTTTLDGQLKYTNGTPGAGKILESDASGNASWETQTPTSYWSASTTGHIVNSGTTTFVGIGMTGTPTFNLFIDEPSVGTALFGDTTKKVSGVGFHWETDKAFLGLMTGDTTSSTQINTILAWGDDEVDKFQLGHYYYGDSTWRPGLTAQYNDTEKIIRFGFNTEDPQYSVHISGNTTIEGVISGTSDLYIDGTIHPGINALKDVIATGTSIVIANNGAGATPTAGSGADNIILGYGALNNGTSGSNNIVVGRGSGNNKTGAVDNILIGKNVMGAPTSASPSGNIIMGHRAGYQFYSAINNVIIGHNAATANVGIDRSVIIGEHAGQYQVGDYQVIIGISAGTDTTGYGGTTEAPVYIGAKAGINMVGNSNVALGPNAGNDGTNTRYTGASNILIGNGTIVNNAASDSTFILGKSTSYLLSGDYAITNNTKLGINIGNTAPTANLQVKGSGTTSAGVTLLLEDSGGNDKLKVTDDGSVTINNVYTMPLTAGTQGHVLTSAGSGTVFWSATTGGGGGGGGATTLDGLTDAETGGGAGSYYNVFLSNGATAGAVTQHGSIGSGTYGNIAIGGDALKTLSSGDYNIGIGYNASPATTTGNNNIAIGKLALYVNNSSDNIAIGTNACIAGSTYGQSIYIGTSAGTADTVGQNTYIGHQAGIASTGGWQNIALGFQANVSSGAVHRTIAIGVQQTTTQSDTLSLGGLSKTLLHGEYGTTAQAKLGINLGTAWTAPSATLHVKGYGTGTADILLLEDGSGNDVVKIDAAGTLEIGKYSNSSTQAGIAIGEHAGNENAVGNNAVVIGYWAGKENNAAFTSTVVIGAGAAKYGSGHNQSVLIGNNAGRCTNSTNANPVNNVMIGYKTGFNTAGTGNVFLGWQAGEDQVSGDNNIFIGKDVQGSTTSIGSELRIGNGSVINISGNTSTGNVGFQNVDVLSMVSGGTFTIHSGTTMNIPNVLSGTSTTYTVTYSDAYKYIRLNNAGAITANLPLDATHNFSIGTEITFLQSGVGNITVSASTGTLNYFSPTLAATCVTAGKFASITAKKIAANTWDAIGNIT